MEIVIKSKASVYFRHNSWCHRYAKMGSDGKREFGSITGFETEDDAKQSFLEYLHNYNAKVEELNNKKVKELNDNYDEDDFGDFIENDMDDNYLGGDVDG